MSNSRRPAVISRKPVPTYEVTRLSPSSFEPPWFERDYGRFVPMHFRSRERNNHTVNVRSRERICGRFVLGTKLPI